MTGTSLAFIFDVFPTIVAAPLFLLLVLAFGMALDEAYVNRATVLTGALALSMNVFIWDRSSLFLGMYYGAGLAIGVYGLYAYVADEYVPNWFRVVAYFLYSPITVLLMSVSWAFVVAFWPFFVVPLAIATYSNLYLMKWLQPALPYYFGPEAPYDVEELVEDSDLEEDRAKVATGEATPDDFAWEVDESGGAIPRPEGDLEHPAGRASPSGGQSSERGVLPEFMRRL